MSVSFINRTPFVSEVDFSKEGLSSEEKPVHQVATAYFLKEIESVFGPSREVKMPTSKVKEFKVIKEHHDKQSIKVKEFYALLDSVLYEMSDRNSNTQLLEKFNLLTRLQKLQILYDLYMQNLDATAQEDFTEEVYILLAESVLIYTQEDFIRKAVEELSDNKVFSLVKKLEEKGLVHLIQDPTLQNQILVNKYNLVLEKPSVSDPKMDPDYNSYAHRLGVMTEFDLLFRLIDSRLYEAAYDFLPHIAKALKNFSHSQQMEWIQHSLVKMHANDQKGNSIWNSVFETLLDTMRFESIEDFFIKCIKESSFEKFKDLIDSLEFRPEFFDEVLSSAIVELKDVIVTDNLSNYLNLLHSKSNYICASKMIFNHFFEKGDTITCIKLRKDARYPQLKNVFVLKLAEPLLEKRW